MQALKIIEKVQEISAETFPVAFARSLVAVANYKEDAFRKICIEALRDLALKNPELVAAVEGFAPMMDAVMEPITQSMADSILLTIIYLLNDPATRAVVAHGVDLRTLVSLCSVLCWVYFRGVAAADCSV
jgi:rapamycin-insensitive companion of mTOR